MFEFHRFTAQQRFARRQRDDSLEYTNPKRATLEQWSGKNDPKAGVPKVQNGKSRAKILCFFFINEYL
jgi:hypothetical protein